MTVGTPGLMKILEERRKVYEQLHAGVLLSLTLTQKASDLLNRISIKEKDEFTQAVLSQVASIDLAKKIMIAFTATFFMILIFFFYHQFFRRLVVRLESLSHSVEHTTGAILSGPGKNMPGIISRFSEKTADVSLGALNEVGILINALNVLLSTMQAQYDEIEKARREAEFSNQAKSQFLANMSHEIRTPINGITGFITLIRHTAMNVKQIGYIDKIDLSCRQLLLIVNDILDFSRLEKSKIVLSMETFRLYDIIEDVLLGAFDQANNKQIDFRLRIAPDVPAEMKGDALRIGQVLKNLMVNAIKFTKQGFIDLQVSIIDPALQEHEKSLHDDRIELLFEVIDTGIGIPPEKKEKLFSKFYQIDDSYTRKASGSGLGLAICKELVALMDGSIRVDSEPGKGSSFTFTVCVEKSQTLDNAILRDRTNINHYLMVTVNSMLTEQTRQLMTRYNMKGTRVDSHGLVIDAISRAESEGDPINLIIFDDCTKEEN